MDTAIATIKQTTALTTNDIARELAGRLKFMIQNGRALQDNEVFALAQYCAANDLNPFSGEAYYIPSAGPCPGIAGWRKKAQEQLNWEAAAQNENGAHFWVETREATTEEAGHDPNAGDIAMFVTLHDWLTNKRWRRAFFDTLRELKEVGYNLEDATAQAKVMVGPEPVWTGVGVVYQKENFGGDKFNRAERASKRAEKIALRKRFPRVNLPEPTGADAGSDVYDTSFTIEPPARKSEAELMAEITGEPAPKSPAPAAPEKPGAWVDALDAALLDELRNTHNVSHVNQIKNALRNSCLTAASTADTIRAWMRTYKSARATMEPADAAAAVNAEFIGQ